MATCKATKLDGTPCRAKAGASGYCFRHDPNIPAEAKAKASSKGGSVSIYRPDTELLHQTATPIELGTLDGMLGALQNTANDVRRGVIDPKTANAITGSINTAKSLHELVLTETRIRKLEEKLGVDNGDLENE